MEESVNNTHQLYQVLKVSKKASQSDIKSAYKKLALLNHPDKNPDHLEKFKDIKHAYDILGDDKKRRIYDRYGEWGINMSNSIGGPLFDPELETKINRFFLLTSVITILTIIFLIFLGNRVDKHQSWHYGLVFIPFWLIDIVLLFSVINLFKWSINQRKAGGAQEKECAILRMRGNLIIAGTLTLNLVLLIAFQILLILKLEVYPSLPGYYIFLPIFVIELLILVPVSIRFSLQYKAAGHILLLERLLLFFNSFFASGVRVIQWVLIVLKLEGVLAASSWELVFVPLYLLSLQWVVGLLTSYFKLCQLPSGEDRKSLRLMIVLKLVLILVGAILSYTFVGLLIKHLDHSTHSLTVVLVPIFIILSLVLCCSGCCFPLCFQFISSPDVHQDTFPSSCHQITYDIAARDPARFRPSYIDPVILSPFSTPLDYPYPSSPTLKIPSV